MSERYVEILAILLSIAIISSAIALIVSIPGLRDLGILLIIWALLPIFPLYWINR